MARQHRRERIGDLVRAQVAQIIHEEFVAPEGVVVTLTRCEVAEDLESAVLFVGVFPDDQSGEVLKRLTNWAGDAQYRLMKRMRTRPIPRIRFVFDKGIAAADNIDKEFQRIKEAEEK